MVRGGGGMVVLGTHSTITNRHLSSVPSRAAAKLTYGNPTCGWLRSSPKTSRDVSADDSQPTY